MAADSVEDQLDILQAFVRGTPPTSQAAPQTAPTAEAPAPPVDPNRPLEPQRDAGPEMTSEYAESILDRIGNAWPKWN
jgi:hypothetical protein